MSSGGVHQNVSLGDNTGELRVAAAGENAKQVLGDGSTIAIGSLDTTEEQITSAQAIELLAQMQALLETANLPDAQKGKAQKFLAAAKEEATESEPDKDYIKSNLERVTKTLEATTATVTASTGLWQSLKPIFTRLAPWLGVAATYFVGGL
ncbi:hypothetical protein IQ235_09625 [Oscillatoriales cyanobacterium LEGE 11467]|uniref:Uncharacterized protein n=1 Tax=Zarconia navalis LEGE 11467 TaxID=1828826 RepID=A0A928VZG5_9CYAN|nr:hypothetical protein [Zarconia navalis]MBE9041038.1 hypothetical protein [Zarconia navalis LEGE 11467]